MILTPRSNDREHLYFVYRLERDAERRWGPTWWIDNPARVERLQTEMAAIASQGFESFFLILAEILGWCREANVITGPGRGSVGGSLACYVLGIHELDSLEWDLSFSRFLNAERVGLPDVDLDVSQRRRQDVLSHIIETYDNERYAVLQVAAFARAGARRTIDMVFAAKSQTDPGAGAIAEQLKKLLPPGAAITGGTKQPQEIAYWIENPGANKHNRDEFVKIATQSGWMPLLEKLDGIQVNLAKHAAGVVIINRQDLVRMPQTGTQDSKSGKWRMMTGYDMYSLDSLGYLKIDILGLRTLDIVADAHKFCGGDGGIDSLMQLWAQERDRNQATYDLLCAADTTGVFQVETGGYRRTLKDFQPKCYDDITQLNALYRPGALDARAQDGSDRNMVQVYIDRRKGKEQANYPGEVREELAPILNRTQGIILYQEQAMKIAQVLAGFSDTAADNLRKGIGKKLTGLMERVQGEFREGMLKKNKSPHMVDVIWENIAAASRYSWNESHARFYSAITWWTAYFKANKHILVPELGLDGPGTAGFYAALINSLSEDKDRQADAVAEARQHVTVKAPDINIAQVDYTVDGDDVVFGFNGIKGMGEANRSAIVVERWLGGPFQSFEDFHRRLPSVPINMKLSLIRCGAFDNLEGRERLLARLPRGPNKEGEMRYWTVAEFLKHNSTLKKPRELPVVTEWIFPSQQELAEGEYEAIGFYVSADPMSEVTQMLGRLAPDSYWGGEVVPGSIKTTKDKRNQEMARFTLLLTSLNKQRCMVFGSDWPQCKPRLQAGARVIVRAREDGNQLIVNAVFSTSDVRHFKVLELTKDGKREIIPFDGQTQTLELAEASGYTVMLH